MPPFPPAIAFPMTKVHTPPLILSQNITGVQFSERSALHTPPWLLGHARHNNWAGHTIPSAQGRTECIDGYRYWRQQFALRGKLQATGYRYESSTAKAQSSTVTATYPAFSTRPQTGYPGSWVMGTPKIGACLQLIARLLCHAGVSGEGRRPCAPGQKATPKKRTPLDVAKG